MIAIVIEKRGALPEAVRFHLPAIHSLMWGKLGGIWHTDFRPRHFTKAGAREYGYQPRAGEAGSGKQFRRSYTGRKLAKFGHTLPLVWTGESRLLTRARDIRATPKGVRVVMKAYKLNYKHPKRRISMRDELTTVTQREVAYLVRAAQGIQDREIGRVYQFSTTRPQ